MIFKQETVKSWFTGVGSSINNEVVQPFQNANSIISKYNLAIQHNSLTQQGWQRLLAQSDDSLKAYLTSIKGTTASVAGYNVSLQGNITGFTKITNAMQQYNALEAISQKEQQAFAGAIGITNTNLGSYLTGLNGAKASLSGYGLSLIASTAKTIGLTVATTALNATLTMGISLIVSGLISAFVSWIHKSEEITEKAQEAADKINSINDSLKSNTEIVENAKKRYAELAQEVENLGKITQSQGTLSNEEYEEFLYLSNQLAGIFPSLTKNYDDNGNAILDLSGDVNTIVGSLDDLIQNEKELANQKIMEEFPDVFKGWNQDLSDAEQKVKSAKTEFDKINNAYQQLSKGSSVQAFDENLKGFFLNESGEKIPIDYHEYIKAAKELGLAIKEEKIWLPNQFGGKDYKGIRVELTGDIDTEFTSKLEKTREDLQYAQQQLEGQTSSINQYLNTWLQTEFSYIQIEDSGLQTAIQDILFNFDWNNISEDKRGDWNYVSEYLRRNILFAINNVQDNNEISTALSEIFTSAELTPDEKANYLQQIQDYFGEDSAVVISLKPQVEETETLQKQYDKAIEDTKKKFDDYDPTAFFKEYSINTQEEIDAWQEIAQEARDAAEAEKEYIQGSTSTPKTFKQAWDALGTTGNEETQKAEQEAKEKLLELAKAGELTPEVLENSETFADLLKSVGNSAAIAADKINKMVEASDQLTSLKTGISAISDVLAEKKENQSNKKTKEIGIGADTLAGFDDAIKGLDSWENFEETLGNGKSSMEDCQKAANKLATEWINSNNFLSKLNKTNKEYYISTLKEMGVKNAEAVVTAALTKKEQELNIEKKWLAAATKDESNETKDLSNATAEQIEKYATENEWVEKTKKAVYALALQKQTANGVHLNTQKDIKQMEALVKGIGGENDAITTYKEMLKHGGSYSTTEMANAWENAKKQIEDATKIASEDTTVDVDVDPSSTTSNSNNSPNPNSNKKTKQFFDWLERKTSVLTNKLDQLKAKIENVFTVKKKNSIIDQEITKTNKLIKAYQKQAKVYKKQAKSSAKSTKTVTEEKKAKLSSGLQKKIQNGQIKGTKKQLIKTYGEKKADAIEEYQNYWDKYQEALTNVQSAKTSKRELKIEKKQNYVDKFDALSDKYDAQIENAKTAKDKNDLENKKLTSTKNSYKQQIKIAKLGYGKNAPQVAKLKAEKKTAVREIKIETQQNLQDEADANRNMLEAQMENATSAKAKNIYLAKEVQYITQSYDAQIKIAKLEGNVAKQHQLEAEKQKELLENKNQQLQNLSDEHSAQYNLNQQLESNAKTAAKKNQYEAASRENLKSQYAYEIQIAHNNGDITEEKRLQAELEEKIVESYKQEIENLKEEYDLMIGIQDARKSTIDSQISALQANGYNVAAELYKEQQEIDLNNYNETLSKISDITAEMQNLDPESQDYKNYLMDLESYKQEAWGYQQAWAEAQQAINDINLSKIEHVGTLLGYQANQLEHIQNILGHSDFTLSDKDIGGLTIEGLSSAAMTLGQMKNNSDQIANKWDQIAEINRQIDAKEYVGTKEQAEEDIYNLLTEIEELEEANYDFGESIKNMVIDSLNSLSDALDESISKYKDALTAQKDLYDYRKKVASQLKSIASLEKQLTALQGSQSEEARARIQQLKISLDEANDNLKETEYEKYIQDQEEILDKVSDDFQDFIANVTDMSVSEICAAVGNAISDHKDDISQAIKDAFAESDAIKSVADNMKSLGEIMSAIDFSTNITLNTDSSGKVTGMSVNGEEIDVPGKDNGMSNVANDIDNASTVPANQKGGDGDLSNTSTSTTTTTATTTTPSITAPKRTETQKKIDAFIPGKLKTKSQLGYSNNIVTQRKKNDPATKYLMGKYSDKSLSYTSEANLANSLAGKLERLPADFNPNKTGATKLTKYGNALLTKLKNAGFSKGGMVSQLNKVAIANGDEGWATLKRGESVLTPAQTKQFRKLTENLFPLNTMAETIASLSGNPIPTTPSPASTTTVRNVDIHLDGSHVMDADSFIQTLHNPRVLQEVSSGVSSQLGNVLSNKLGTF